MKPVRVLIVANHPVVRAGLHSMLSTDPTVKIVDEACDGKEAVAKVAEKNPDVVLMDTRMPSLDGIEATRRIKDKCHTTSVVLLAMYDDNAYVIDAIKAGASGYLLKDTSRELLLYTIRTVSSGATLIKTNLLSEAISSLIQPQKVDLQLAVTKGRGMAELTPREHEVLKLLAVGDTNKAIAEKLIITEDTVKKHVQNIIAKLDAGSRTAAAVKAAQAGMID